MAGSQCNKFRGDKGKVIQVLVVRVMLLVLKETMQMDRKGLLNATTIKMKNIWLGNALSLSDLEIQHDLGVPDGQAVEIIIPNKVSFQTKDLDTYDSDCDHVSNAKAVLKANISNYGSDVISEAPHSETYCNDTENQTRMSADEVFWYHMLNPSTKSSNALPVKIESPKELPKVSLVNGSLKKLKLHLTNFDKVVKIRTTPNALTEGD
nr:hypothetical protein [Tanacetum cinerariifolium]